MDPLVDRMTPFRTTIFAHMSALAASTGSINLGQGFPDVDGPPELLDAAVAAIRAGHNQYPPGAGEPELLRAVAAHQRRFYDLSLDPDREVLVTVGATEAIAASVLALCEPGDEVVTFEPYYDSYAASIALAGARRRTVTLRFPDFSIDPDELAAAFSPRTRFVLLNSPHNPTGKVFTRTELELVAELAREHDCWVVTDEVYEHITFDGAVHVPMSTLPGMFERTLTISSAGKTFSATGWKVGWVSGPAELVAAVRTVKQFLTYTAGGPFQLAVAAALALPDQVYDDLAAGLQAKRDLLCAALTDAGLAVSRPAGTYFAIADLAPLAQGRGLELSQALVDRCRVATIPVSVFHDDVDAAATLVRFAFCKQDAVLAQAAQRIAGLRADGEPWLPRFGTTPPH